MTSNITTATNETSHHPSGKRGSRRGFSLRAKGGPGGLVDVNTADRETGTVL